MTTTDNLPHEGLLEALADALDTTLVSSRRVSTHVSGDGLVTAYEVEFATGPAGEKHLIYVETGPRQAKGSGVLTFVDEQTGDQATVWVYPKDPALPALEAAVYPAAASVLMERLGVIGPDAPTIGGSEDITLTLAAYRPGRRAVIRVDIGRHSDGTADRTVFLKVVPPGAAASLASRHKDWLAAGLPVPPVFGWSDEGLLAIAALGGAPALALIARVLPSRFVAALRELQQQIATVPGSVPARASLASRLDWYQRRLSALTPEHDQQITRISRSVERVLAANPARRAVTIHGDLHLGQVFVDPDELAVVGVLDIDTAGLGDPADDAAALYAHLVVTAVLNRDDPPVADSCERLAKEWADSWAEGSPVAAASASSGRLEGGSYARRATAIAATHLLAHGLNESLDTALLLDRADTLVANIGTL